MVECMNVLSNMGFSSLLFQYLISNGVWSITHFPLLTVEDFHKWNIPPDMKELFL
eukprot:UN08947